jgi:hypothetical protein
LKVSKLHTLVTIISNSLAATVSLGQAIQAKLTKAASERRTDNTTTLRIHIFISQLLYLMEVTGNHVSDATASSSAVMRKAAAMQDKVAEVPSLPNPHGEDTLVVLDYVDQTPVKVVMREKLTVADLRAKFGDEAIVYLVNKNMHCLPRFLMGAVIWIPSKTIVGVIIQAQGLRAVVKVFHPEKLKHVHVMIQDLRIEGFFLQLIVGCVPFMHALRRSEVCKSSGRIATLVDQNGCIKMSVEGPDVVMSTRVNLSKEEKTFLNMSQLIRIPMNVRRPKSAIGVQTTSRRKRKGGPEYDTPVVYVYSENGADEYKFVQRHLEEDVGNKMESNPVWKPLFSVPYGKPYGGNDR